MTKLNKFKFKSLQLTIPPEIHKRIKEEKEKRYFNVSYVVSEFLRKKFKIKENTYVSNIQK